MYRIEKVTLPIRSPFALRDLSHSQLSNPTVDYVCGSCGKRISGTVVAFAPFFIGPKMMGEVHWTYCNSCGQPAVVRVFDNPQRLEQWPLVIEFAADSRWPDELARLFNEAAVCFASSSFTATAMLCRKILMVCAVDKGDTDGQSFAHYVDYLSSTILTYPAAKASLDGMKRIANDANHKVSFATEAEGRKAMQTAKYLLDAVYALPTV